MSTCASKVSIKICVISALSIVTGCAPTLQCCPGPSPVKVAEQFIYERKDNCPEVADVIDTNLLYHVAAVQENIPKPPTNYPFILLGFEKPRKNYDRPYAKPDPLCCGIAQFDPELFKAEGAPEQEVEKTRDDIEDRLFGDERSLVLTHSRLIWEAQDCDLLNIYSDPVSNRWCSRNLQVSIQKSNWSREVWKVLPILKEELQDLATAYHPTHIILLSTGWNTQEIESLIDYQLIIDNLAKAMGSPDFRPIFVGIGWESEWRTLPRLLSLYNKGNDADELGFTWINYVLNDVLAPIAIDQSADLVAIGHSYGSRVVFGAHYGRDVMNRCTPPLPSPNTTIIGLQAAFPTGRFIAKHGGEHQYLAANKRDATVVVSTSVHDKATSTMSFPGTTGYVGGKGGIDELIEERACDYESAVKLTTADLTQVLTLDRSKVNVVDVSAFVNCQLPGTSSGAHSDIYDAEMGKFIASIIKASGAKNSQ